MKRLIHTLAATALLAIPTTAAAADHELSFELGTTGHSADDNWQLFDDYSDAQTTLGLRAGFAVHDRVAVIAGWQHGASGSWIEMPGYEGGGGDWDEDYYDGYSSGPALGMAYYNDTFSLGAKADWPVAVWFRPYVTVQGLGIMSKVRVDDDTSTDDNPNQLERSAFDFGGAATGGLDFRIPIKQGAWALASYLELGYQYATPASFGELGAMTNRGLLFRWGLGARF
jgi:hypothetical protein